MGKAAKAIIAIKRRTGRNSEGTDAAPVSLLIDAPPLPAMLNPDGPKIGSGG